MVFGIIITLLVTLIQLYVFLRLATVPFVAAHVSGGVLAGAGALLWVIFALGRFVGHESAGPAASALEFTGMTWLGILFLAFAALLAVDAVTLFGLVFAKQAPMLRGIALLFAAALAVTALVQGARAPAVERYEVAIAGLPAELDGTVIAGMSDLHVGTMLGERWLEERIAQVEALQPDIVVLLGDLFEGHGQPVAREAAILRRIEAPLGVFAVKGNHEHYNNNGADALLAKDGRIAVLHNRWVEPAPGLILAGVDDLTENRRRGKNRELVAQALADRPAGATILLSHTPWQVEQAAALGANLMLSGHTHGGQLWPMGYLTRLFYPFMSGRYEVGGMTLIVCRGTGTWGPRMRLWPRGEILHVTLRTKGA